MDVVGYKWKGNTYWSVKMSALPVIHWLEQICRVPHSLLPIYTSYCQCTWPSTLGSSIHLNLKSNHTTSSSIEWSLVCMRKETHNYGLLCLSFSTMIMPIHDKAAIMCMSQICITSYVLSFLVSSITIFIESLTFWKILEGTLQCIF